MRQPRIKARTYPQYLLPESGGKWSHGWGYLLIVLATALVQACQVSPSVTPRPSEGSSNLGAASTFELEIRPAGLLTPSQLAEILSQKDFFFVNTHVPYEGEIDPTDALIPFDQIEQEIGQFPADKGAKIVVYCRSGRMSAIAADSLARLGYTNVWDLGGGMVAWEEAGFTIAGK